MVRQKVLILANTFYPILGGVETHLLDLLKEISIHARDFEVHLIAYTYWDDKNNPYLYKHKDIKVRLLRLCPRNPKSLIQSLERRSWFFYFLYNIAPFFFYTFFYCLKNPNFDIIHAQSHTTGKVAIIISKLFGIKKKYISMHGIMFSTLENFQQYTPFRKRIKKQFQKFDKIFCIGSRSYNEVKELMDGNEKQLTLFRYWVDERFFQETYNKKSARNQIGFGERKIIFYAGRLVETKGIIVLLEVAQLLPEYDFFIAGGGILTEIVQEYTSKHSNIQYLGSIENYLLPIYYTASDLSILLTQGDGEGIPRALIESIACGTPIIATARGGTQELIDLGTGCIVENNVEGIKNTLVSLLENKLLYSQKQKVCRPVAKQYFSKENAQVFVQSYQ